MTKKSKKKKWIIAIVIIVIVIGGLFGWNMFRNNSSTATVSDNIGQENLIGVVSQMDISDEIYADGFLEMESESVYMETDGIVEEVLVEEGEYVEEGQILLRLERDDIAEDIEDATISLSDAYSSYETAKRNADIAETLYAEGGVTQNEVLSKQETLSKSYNAYLTKKNTLERLNEDYDNMEVKAVASGTLLNMVPSVSDKVLEDSEIAVIAVSEKMTLTADIEEYDIPFVSVGSSATVTVSALDKDYEGTVVSIAPVATSGTVSTVEAVIELNEADDALIPGYSVEVSINSVDLNDVTVVPYTAIRTINEQDVIFLVQDDNTLKMQSVETGYEDVLYTQIMNDELVGQKIIRTALSTMQDGMTLEEAITLSSESTTSEGDTSLMMMPGAGAGGGTAGGERPERKAE
ncbi:efflux RND transporter periplasmic adaptor subunit [Clostridia bacterium]|nr:efflux RND transporter periplasmic adaptor subunit [Clostridia bacterium]